MRGQLGFNGLVLTDSLSAGAISQAGYDVNHAAVVAVTVGADMILYGSTLTPADAAQLSPANVKTSIAGIVAPITAAVGNGSLPAGRLETAAEHVIAAQHANVCSG